MGQMRIVEGGIQLDGQAIIVDELRTSHIKSRHGQPITFGKLKFLFFLTKRETYEWEKNFFHRIFKKSHIQYERLRWTARKSIISG